MIIDEINYMKRTKIAEFCNFVFLSKKGLFIEAFPL